MFKDFETNLIINNTDSGGNLRIVSLPHEDLDDHTLEVLNTITNDEPGSVLLLQKNDTLLLDTEMKATLYGHGSEVISYTTSELESHLKAHEGEELDSLLTPSPQVIVIDDIQEVFKTGNLKEIFVLKELISWGYEVIINIQNEEDINYILEVFERQEEFLTSDID